MLVEDFKENVNARTPNKLLNLLPSVCKCGSPLEITSSLSIMYCSNPRCKVSVIQRVKSMLKDIGIRLSEEIITTIIDKTDITLATDLFGYDVNQYGAFTDNLSVENTKDILDRIREYRNMSLSKYIYINHLPYLDESIEILFKDCNDLEKFYINLEEQGIKYLYDLFGYDSEYDSKFSVHILKVYEILQTYKKDLLNGLENIVIV